MRVASICDTCATYINAACIIYNGDYLQAINASPLDSLDIILEGINDSLKAINGSGIPVSIPAFYGQLYIDSGSNLYIGLSETIPNWGFVGNIVTTTTTTSTSSTTTTTTTVA